MSHELNEISMPVPRYEDCYAATSHGQLKSTRNRSTFGTGGKTRDKDGFLKSFRKSLKSPYLRVSLSRDGEKENVDVAHMVATVDYQIYVFHPPPGNLQATHEAAGPRPAWAY